jgi:hypothetical protein
MINAEIIYQKSRQLDDFHLQEVADFIDFLVSKTQPNKRGNNTSITQDFQPALALEASGLMGCVEGPEDLSENYKEYLNHHWTEKYDHC